jgi:hypothetical protein
MVEWPDYSPAQCPNSPAECPDYSQAAPPFVVQGLG